MQSSNFSEACEECSGRMIDLGDELVCRSCGVVASKEVIEGPRGNSVQAIDFTNHALGGYMGPAELSPAAERAAPFGAGSSTLRYLKLVSDFAGKDGGALYTCAKMVERVSEKLNLPGFAVAQAMVLARKLVLLRETQSDISVAAISSYSIITACKMEGITGVGSREVIEAHRAMGRRVKLSNIFEISFQSPVVGRARRPDEFLSSVIAKLSARTQVIKRSTEVGLNQASYFNSLRDAASCALGLVPREAFDGFTPLGLAATAVYAGEVSLARASGRSRVVTQKEVAGTVAMGEYTIREQYGRIFKTIQSKLDAALTQRTILVAKPSS
jgi:transcription initiation factor TFIIIB Brf1 subunit/transcription initiation factor TFIIB